MKKRYLLASMMVLAAVSLAGCGGNSASKANTSVVSESTADTAASSSDSTETSAKDTEADTETKDTTEASKDTTEEPSDPDADSSADMEASNTADSSAEDAKAYIGVSMDEFKSAFGQPNSSSAADSDGGKAGTYTYDTFTVTTHTDADGNEIVDSVE